MNRVIGNHHKTAWFLQTGVAVNGEKAKEMNIVDRMVNPDGDEEGLMAAAVKVLKEEYFFAKSVSLDKKTKCAATARRNGRLEELKELNDLLSGKRQGRSGGDYIGLRGMTKKRKQSKL